MQAELGLRRKYLNEQIWGYCGERRETLDSDIIVPYIFMVEALDPSLTLRKIIHFDMDAFYAAVEARDDPSLRGRPLVVGGSPQSRAVVCTASYEARRYGIRSAMPCSQAARLCPEAIFLAPDFPRYQAASHAIHAIFARYTSLIEPLSLDEAYLDVSSHPSGLYAVRIARLIQEEVRDCLHLSGSAGVAPNKLVAKIASDRRKPGGLTVVLPAQVTAFMADLPLRCLHGIGPVSERRLAALGLRQCRDVWAYEPWALTAKLGRWADWLAMSARGIDHRPVAPRPSCRSLGRETTFPRDLGDRGAIEAMLADLAEDVASELRQRQIRARTITLKVRYADFTRRTRQRSLALPVDDAATLLQVACELLRQTEYAQRRLRLVGISVRVTEAEGGQPVSSTLSFVRHPLVSEVEFRG